MFATLQELYLTEPTACEEVLPAVRELISWHPTAAYKSPNTLARLLWILRYLPYRPEIFKVETALEALRVEGEVLP
jgi:hypothetical protein